LDLTGDYGDVGLIPKKRNVKGAPVQEEAKEISTMSQLANALTNPKEAKEKAEIKHSKMAFAQLIMTKRWPDNCSLVDLLVAFGKGGKGIIKKGYTADHTKKLIKTDKNICLQHCRNFIFQYNYKQGFREQVTAAALQSLGQSDWTAAVILAGFQEMLESILRKNNNILPGISFTFGEFDEAVDRACRDHRQDALSAYTHNSGSIDASLGSLYKYILVDKGYIDRADATLSWAQIISKKKGGNSFRVPRPNGGNAAYGGRNGFNNNYGGRNGVNNYNARNRSNTNQTPKIRGAVYKELLQKYGKAGAEKLKKESMVGGTCLGYNYLSCPFGPTKCRFAHVCSKCNEPHPAKDCPDNYDVIKNTIEGINKK